MNETDELTALEQLTTGPAWGVLMAHFQQQWGQTGKRYVELLEKVANATEVNQTVIDEFQRVTWMRKEMELFFSYFPQRFKQLTHMKHPQLDQNRRGVL